MRHSAYNQVVDNGSCSWLVESLSGGLGGVTYTLAIKTNHHQPSALSIVGRHAVLKSATNDATTGGDAGVLPNRSRKQRLDGRNIGGEAVLSVPLGPTVWPADVSGNRQRPVCDLPADASQLKAAR